jgi:hypothetical protein
MKLKTQLLAATFLLLSSQCESFGQRTFDPNLNHYYMGRQQITITDEAPMVNDKTGGAAGGGGGGANGGLPGRPTALPRSGFQSYSPEAAPANTRSLPKLVNGVPPKSPPPQAAGHKGKAGKLASNKSNVRPQSPSTPTGASAYKPYATYGTPSAPASAAGSSSSQSNVKGNLLHWARGNRHN